MNPLIECIGLEFEVAQVPKTTLRRIARETGYRLVEDGSCRSIDRALHGIPVASGGRRETFGGELVSPVIDTSSNEKWKKQVRVILDGIREIGEGHDLRTSTHVHINCNGLPLFVLHNILRIGLYLESAMFRLACAEMGVHRGSLNRDYAYCRPISAKGPPIVNQEEPRAIFSTMKLLNAKTTHELYVALGRLDNWGGGKYHEARYVWLNLVTFFQRGTVEFRQWNSTHHARNVFAWVELCKSIVRAGFGKGMFEETNPLGTDRIIFADVVESLMLDDNKTTHTLEKLWNMADYQPPIKGRQWGHLNQLVRWKGVPKRLVPPEVHDVKSIYSFNEFEALKPGFDLGSIPLTKKE